jgi:hypothetical protein
MPASPGVQRAAARICGSAVLACALIVLGAWHAAQPRTDNAQSADWETEGKEKMKEVGYLLEGPRGPVLSSLLETQLAETCDCSKPKKCEEDIKTDIKQRLPGGGAGGLRGLDWGAWDPVTGVPRIDCPDTVTHAYCKPRPARARRLCLRLLRLCIGLRAPWFERAVSECHAPLGCLSGRHSLQGRKNRVYIAHEPLLWLDDVSPGRHGAVEERLHSSSRGRGALH